MSSLSVEKCPGRYEEYSFTLDKQYLKIAQENLQETVESREQSLAQMREWIAKHPYIRKCRTDSLFLLRFLRMRKFSVPRAQETIERYLAMRQTFPQWFQTLDPNESDMAELLDDNQFQLLGRDSKGRTVVLIRLKNFNAEKFNSAHQARAMMLFLETIFDEEESQIGGYVAILDYADISMRLVAVWSLMDVKNFMNCVNHSLPVSIKEVHGVRLPKFAVVIAELALSCLSQKLKDRVFFKIEALVERCRRAPVLTFGAISGSIFDLKILHQKGKRKMKHPEPAAAVEYSSCSVTGRCLTGLFFNWALDNWAVAQLKSRQTSKNQNKPKSPRG
ncbi:conserved hypothetical protein [Culex quinquefasciatus]|uniref:CRAL-TRIO domain-containing protein n=1 Tax=Culex quinquefasciatus TaxID=7176 RepID=B0XFB3_CULQU|nr:conserved hypothetical protein [Culex quinquefasciatus]|eukprot:XP_001868335.1 conserved hypothetical protein [Culex quinquefasciatus]